jgi:3-phenylpropionate/trans-cinnamate dioxygenase ferredoxin subunit
MSEGWTRVCGVDEIDVEDVIRFDHGGRTFAVYRTEDGGYFASDGLCTHEGVHLADGFVIGSIIECPRHQGRFHIPTGAAKGAPVCVDLKTYQTRVDDGSLFIKVAG